MAHDFNNILQSMMGYAQLAAQDAADRPELHEALNESSHGGERAAALTRQLLAFTRHQRMEPKNVNPDELIRSFSRMLNLALGEHIEYRFKGAGRDATVRVDPSQIEQVLMNLCVNARDAMPAGGRLMIETENMTIDGHYCRDHTDVRPGRYVRISVTDTGCGMDRETLDRVFEPFFTTKEVGKGTGLGLSTVYGIVSQHEGAIHVYSEPGLGTTFRIYFPVVDGEAERGSGREIETSRGGTETLLLAEDDAGVRDWAGNILLSAGYRVITARDGEEALAVIAEKASQIRAAVLDVVMPRHDGAEVADALRRAAAPDTPILFVSGYSADLITDKRKHDAHAAFLSKPCSSAALLRKVRELLDGAEEV
ncbi:ATP-binding protein [Kiritimatiella glycovorans]|uniref:histidine kinase n=1 Tax=Kiritimatiella glycovorans TaxID=1307763 RepID=A0A0G3EAT9_9BACT|nr:ATP-binding protein [Kiritimatiella glycovorans]AKJ63378.1 PAS/PAC sensor hybrid histidine kinase [Kiritimatiella glycovorans]